MTKQLEKRAQSWTTRYREVAASRVGHLKAEGSRLAGGESAVSAVTADGYSATAVEDVLETSCENYYYYHVYDEHWGDAKSVAP